MATPSSSATSESPPMAYLHANPVSAPPITAAHLDTAEKEERKKAVQKFLARAEVSMVTRGLRARLSYASYKATHNIPHVSLRDLEAQSQSQSHPNAQSRIGAKRKSAGGSNNYYNNPATQGTSSPRRGTMAPPLATTSAASRSHYPNAANRSNSNSTANATQSLYASILAPPPAKHARTIHNVNDPPLAAPSRPNVTARRGAADQAQSARRKGRDKKGKEKERRKGVKGSMSLPAPSGEDDMKAAATLTSLLMHSRPTASASSPRSSISTASDATGGSYSHFAQSSARTTTTTTAATSADSSFNAIANNNIMDRGSNRSTTPPPRSSSGGTTTSVTPRPATDDSEAADLMLFLATSPSPARPTTTNRDKDMAAYRALGGGSAIGGLKARGRVLFPGSEGSGSFASTVSDLSIRDAAGAKRLSGAATIPNLEVNTGSTGALAGPMEPTVIPPTPTAPTPSQLLPPPPSPPRKQPQRTDHDPPKSMPTIHAHAPPTPGFNLNDFINVSPSSPAGGGGQRNSSLRADVGRRLFEEEQVQRSIKQGERHGRTGSGLGAGIDLVR